MDSFFVKRMTALSKLSSAAVTDKHAEEKLLLVLSAKFISNLSAIIMRYYHEMDGIFKECPTCHERALKTQQTVEKIL